MNVLSEFKLGPLTLKNRVVLAPMTRNRAVAGHVPNDLAIEYYRQRASGGLLITEATQIMPEGIGYPDTPGIHSEEQIAGWKKVTAAVHQAGGRIFLQLWHVGRISHPLFQPNQQAPVSASAVAPAGKVYTPAGMKPFETPRPLTIPEIHEITAKYAQGAQNAIAAGFDGVEIHGANGYLLDQFLQDGVNKRTDEYGGKIENRARFLLEATRAVIAAVGKERTAVRLSPNGTFNDMSDSNPQATFTYAISELNKLEIVYLHLREGTPEDLKHGRQPVPVEVFRALFSGPLMINDGYTKEKADAVIAAGQADLVAFGAIYLANPDLPERFAKNAPLNKPNPKTFYGGGAAGYTDYPTLETAAH